MPFPLSDLATGHFSPNDAFATGHFMFRRMGVSHVCLTMTPDNELLVWKNRGRPTEEEREVMKCPDKMREQIDILKQTMSLNSNTEVLLCISIASDEMIRHVNMFPEVFFMDVTANTNRQKRELFVMTVKDASGECFPGNLTVIPSGQLWVYHHIYQTMFMKLYGPATLSRLRLALTDDDQTEHGPFDDAIKTNSAYNKAHHMLCIFHALVKAFHEQVYPLLPGNKGKGVGKRKLTEKGRTYCECIVIM